MSFKFKKALALAVSIMLALSVVAFTVQADTVKVTDITFEDKENSVDVTVTFTAPTGATELTLLAATADSVTAQNIAEVAVGLDQFNNDGVGTVTFPMEKPTEDTTVYVRMGGTGAASENLYSETYEVSTTPPATTYTVSFEVNGAAYGTAQTVADGGKATKPADPTVSGYTFNYWELNGAEYNFDTAVTARITLTAKLTPVATGNVVTVTGMTFADGADADTVDVTVTYSAPSSPAELTLLATKTDEVTEDNISAQAVGIDQFANPGTDSVTFPIVKPTEDTVIYVRMGGTGAASANLYNAEYKVSTTNNWTVTYLVNDSTYQTQEVADGKTASKPADPVVSGYIFEGWEIDGATYDFETPVTADVTLTAKLTAIPVTEDGVTVGSVVFTQSAADDNKVDVVVTYAAPADATAMNIAVATDSGMTSDVYFGKFTHTNGTYTFTIDKPNVKTLYVSMGGDGLTSSGVYEAAYEISEGTVQHKVTFVVTESTVYYDMQVARGTNATAPTDPTFDGYTFAGWYLGGAEEPFNFTDTPITEDIVLTAKWNVVTCTVTYQDVDGSTLKTKTLNYGASITDDEIEALVTVEDGYKFYQWVDADGNPVTTVTGDVTVKATTRKKSSSPATPGVIRPGNNDTTTTPDDTTEPDDTTTPDDTTEPDDTTKPDDTTTGFTDVTAAYDWAKDSINTLAEIGIINGKGDGVFDPAGTITRAEIAKMLVLVLNLEADVTDVTLSDVASDAWYAEYVKTLSALGIMEGYGDGSFRPENLVTREESAKLLAKAIGAEKLAALATGEDVTFADADKISDWAMDSVVTLAKAGLFQGDAAGYYNPASSLTRAEAAVLFGRILAAL